MTEAQTLTLTEFLLARIAEDEEQAEQERADWIRRDGGWDPDHAARVLAECEAKRRIVDNAERARVAADAAPFSERVAASDGPSSAYWRGQDWVCRILTAVYADHPDYRDEWRP